MVTILQESPEGHQKDLGNSEVDRENSSATSRLEESVEDIHPGENEQGTSTPFGLDTSLTGTHPLPPAPKNTHGLDTSLADMDTPPPPHKVDGSLTKR